MQTDARPGRIWYFAAVALGVAGIAACVLLVLHFLARLDTGDQFIVPGSHAFVVEKTGKQLVWNDYRTVFQGRAYDAPERLPEGLRIRVTEGASGKPVEVISSRGATSTTAEAERVSIASFEAAPGRYEIVVEGDFPPRVFSIGPSFLPELFLTIAGSVMAVLAGITAAIGVAVWTFLKRNPSLIAPRPAVAPVAGAAGSASPPVKASPEESARQMAILVYALQTASFVMPITLVAAVVVSYVKRDDVAGTWLESHRSEERRVGKECRL